MSEAKYILDVIKFDEELFSPEKYLQLADKEKADILTSIPLVKPLGASSLDDDDFVSVLVKWKTPKYKMSL